MLIALCKSLLLYVPLGKLWLWQNTCNAYNTLTWRKKAEIYDVGDQQIIKSTCCVNIYRVNKQNNCAKRNHTKEKISKQGRVKGFGEQGWRSGESARLPPMCPGFDSRTRRHMWAEFVGSLLCSERFFSGNSVFPLSSKTNIWFDLIWFIWFTVSPISTALMLG